VPWGIGIYRALDTAWSVARDTAVGTLEEGERLLGEAREEASRVWGARVWIGGGLVILALVGATVWKG
jgi:hypothetical protein